MRDSWMRLDILDECQAEKMSRFIEQRMANGASELEPDYLLRIDKDSLYMVEIFLRSWEN